MVKMIAGINDETIKREGIAVHIVYVTWLFAESENEALVGGIPNYLCKISKYMQMKGHDVTIVVSGKEKRCWNYQGIPIYTVQIPFAELCSLCHADSVLNPVFREFAFRKALKEISDKKTIDIVQYAAGNGTGMLHDKRFISVMRASTYSRIETKGFVPDSEYRRRVLYEKLAASSFDYIFAPSKSWGIPLSREIKKKVTIIPTPYEIEGGMKEDKSVYNRILKGKKYFLYFGRIDPRKGILTIARCIKEILEKHREYYICFAGSIQYYNGKNLMQLLRQSAEEYKERVIYVGGLQHSTLYPIIRYAECILMPSLNDNLPNACLEALLLNGIVIGTRGASFDEIYQDGESGYLIDIDNSIQLVETIDKVVGMPGHEKERMRNKAKEVLQKYTFKKAGGQLERYYQWVICKSNIRNRVRFVGKGGFM